MSKKTEKIEVRVTPEEKDQVARIAQSEGRSVSDLVRNILQSYIAAQSAGETKLVKVARSKTVWGLASLIAALSAIFTVAMPAQAEVAYTVEVTYAGQEGEDGKPFSKNWSKTLQTEFGTVYDFPEADGLEDIGVKIRFLEQEDDTVFAHLKICHRTGDDCEVLAEPQLQCSIAKSCSAQIGSVVIDPDTQKEVPHNLITVSIVPHKD